MKLVQRMCNFSTAGFVAVCLLSGVAICQTVCPDDGVFKCPPDKSLREQLDDDKKLTNEALRVAKEYDDKYSTNEALKEQTRVIQKELKAAGFDPGPVDGILGKKTRAAVIDFQRSHGLVPDGIVGRQTAASLNISVSQ